MLQSHLLAATRMGAMNSCSRTHTTTSTHASTIARQHACAARDAIMQHRKSSESFFCCVVPLLRLLKEAAHIGIKPLGVDARAPLKEQPDLLKTARPQS